MTLCVTCRYWRDCRALPADGACAGYVQGEVILADGRIERQGTSCPACGHEIEEGEWGLWCDRCGWWPGWRRRGQFVFRLSKEG